MTDPVADMLTRIRNALMRKHQGISLAHSKLKQEIARVLKEEGYILDYKVIHEGGNKRRLDIHLKYGEEGEPVITKLARVSKPGRRVFKGVKELERVLGGLGILIVSTSKGILSDRQARRLNIGGEVICKVW
jgi:small subunit ribosomal protein S8